MCVTQDFGQPLMALCVRVHMLSVHLSVCLSVYLSVCLSVCMSVCMSVCLSTHAFVFANLLHFSLSRKGCDPGMYLPVDDTCLPCPANSNSTQSGESVCPCFEGYYRAAGEPPEMECTRKSCAGVCLLGVYGISLFITYCLHLTIVSVVFSLANAHSRQS